MITKREVYITNGTDKHWIAHPTKIYTKRTKDGIKITVSQIFTQGEIKIKKHAG